MAMKPRRAPEDHGITHFVQCHRTKLELNARIQSGNDECYFNPTLQGIDTLLRFIELDQPEARIAAGPKNKPTHDSIFEDLEHLIEVVIDDQSATIGATGSDHQVDMRIVCHRVRTSAGRQKEHQTQEPASR